MNILGRDLDNWNKILKTSPQSSINSFSRKTDLMDLDEAIEILRMMYNDSELSIENRMAIERILFFIDIGV